MIAIQNIGFGKRPKVDSSLSNTSVAQFGLSLPQGDLNP